jgi:pimeloyl-ACP methyl ester carboxylesterase
MRGDPRAVAQRSAMTTLIREGWGQDNPAFRQMFASLFVPGAPPEQMQWFNALQRDSVAPDTAARLYDMFGGVDVSADLAKVSVPTLVLHARDDAVVPLQEGRALADGIPGARFVLLDSINHILLAHEPAFAHFLEEVRGFVGKGD